MRRKTKVLFMALSMCCMLLINSSYVMAANPDNNFSKMEEKVDGKIYNEKGDVLNLSYIEFKSSCTHASGNRVLILYGSIDILDQDVMYIKQMQHGVKNVILF